MVSVGNCTDIHPPAMAIMMAGVSELGSVACNKTTLSRGGRRRLHTIYILPACVKLMFIYIHASSGKSGISLIHVNRLLICKQQTRVRMSKSASARICCCPRIVISQLLCNNARMKDANPL